MTRVSLALLLLAGCSSTIDPNTARTKYDTGSDTIQIMVSDTQPVTTAALVGPDGTLYAATSVNVVETPHAVYQAPPSVGLGIGGWNGNVGSAAGIGLPLGDPTPSRVTDQFISTVLLPAPADYRANWPAYKVQVQVGNRALTQAAPKPE
jgi:hypothetical protein